MIASAIRASLHGLGVDHFIPTRILALVPDRLPLPGPSFLREHEIVVAGRVLRAGMARPTSTDDGWWLAILWVADDNGVVSFRDLAPSSGPPPAPPAARIGPALSGALSGLILEENGRLGIQLAPVAPPDDPALPWSAPAAIRAAIRFEPARASTMRTNELAEVVLTAFRRAIEALARP
jgi:hypothetical protein